jgi:hypothetical protein
MNGRPTLQRGYSLGALFVLIAACAVALSLTALLVRDPDRLRKLGGELAGAAVSMSILGAVLGSVLGLFHCRRGRGAGWGALVGWLVGLFSAPVLFISAAAFPGLLLTAMVGSVLVIATAAVVRLQTGHVPQPQSSDPAIPPVASQARHPLDPDPED